MANSPNKIIRIAASMSNSMWDQCVFNQTHPCFGCKMNEKCGGLAYQYYRFHVVPIFNATPIFVKCTGFGITEGNESTINKLMRNEVDIAGPTMSLEYNRTLLVPAEYPLFYTNFSAVVKKQSVAYLPIVNKIGTDIFHLLLAMFVSYLIVEGLEYFYVNNFKRKGSLPREIYWFWPYVMHWIMVSAAFAYFGSAVTITLQEPPKQIPPFKDFYDLALKAEQHQLSIVTLYKTIDERLFESQNGSMNRIYEVFSRVKQKNRPKILPLDEAIQSVIRDPTNVLLLMGEAEKKKVEQDYCKEVYFIHDVKNELPYDISSFYYSHAFYNQSRAKPVGAVLNYNQLNVLRLSYSAVVTWYTWNSNNDCGMPQSSNYLAALAFSQFETLVYYTTATFLGCFGVLLVERIHYRENNKLNMG